MDTTKKPVKIPGLICRDMEDGMVIVSPEGGEVRVLNEVGSSIWQLIDGQNTSSDITDLISQEYDVSSNAAAADVESFLASLVERGLLTWAVTDMGES